MDLHAVVGDPHAVSLAYSFAIDDSSVVRPPRVLQVRGAIGQQPRRFDARGGVGELPLNRLKRR